jgi:hypothetical protein
MELVNMASKREVGAGTVREWVGTLTEAERTVTVDGVEVELSIGKRGKLSDNVIKAFEKANKRTVYVPGFVESRKITGLREDANGRKRPVTVTATLPQVREWAAAEGLAIGERGRVSSAVLSAFAARPKDTATVQATV